MKQLLTILSFLLLFQFCKQHKAEPVIIENDFTDKIVNLIIKEQDYQFLEFPQLYFNTVTFIPPIDQEYSILVKRLEERGFKAVSLNQINQQLSGRRIMSVILTKEQCECEVQKIYYSTANISEYIVSERMRCIKASK
jgi:hypothetical protein